jgi:ArsR family transcriptional regulator
MVSKARFSDSFCSRRLKTISDPTRWSVVSQLVSGDKSVAELNAVLGLDETLLSHHLKILREEGFVQFIRDGKIRRYHLGPEVKLTPSGRGIDLGCCQLELDKTFQIAPFPKPRR